jgi:hypothetical protein
MVPALDHGADFAVLQYFAISDTHTAIDTSNAERKFGK